MKRALSVLFFAALPCLAAAAEEAPPPAPAALPPPPSDLAAFWREGQVFITWKEVSEDAAKKSVRGERYRVYRSGAPIADVKAAGVALVAVVEEDSSRFRVEGDRGSGGRPTRGAHGVRRLCVEPGTDLAPGMGLVVLTTKKAGAYHYAVATEADGRESAPLATEAAVEEKVAPPGCVLLKALSDSAWYFLRYGDYEAINPDGRGTAWLGCAHAFLVTVPAGYDAAKRPPLPLRVWLHGFGATGAAYRATPKFAGEVALLLPQDFGNTWWHGHADAIPPAGPEALPVAKGVVRAQTRARVLAGIDWLLRAPANAPVVVDARQVYLYGHSMGGYGALATALARPDLFSGALATKTPLDFPDAGPWAEFTRPIWGTRKERLRNEKGAPALDALGLARRAGDTSKDEPPLLEISASRCDRFAPAAGLAEFARALERARVPYFAHWGLYGHSGGTTSGARVSAFRTTRGESVLALANASCNDSLGRAPDVFGVYSECTEEALRVDIGVELVVGGEVVKFKGWRKNELAGRRLVLWPRPGAKSFTIASNTADSIMVKEAGLLAAARARPEKPRLSDAAFLVCEGDAAGYLNAAIEWSCASNDFDPRTKADDLVDTPKEYAVTLRLVTRGDGEYKPGDAEATATVDVTPRRTQKFRPASRARVEWENVSLADPKAPKVVASGRARADRAGLVTVPKFLVGKKGLGNRLVVKVR